MCTYETADKSKLEQQGVRASSGSHLFVFSSGKEDAERASKGEEDLDSIAMTSAFVGFC